MQNKSCIPCEYLESALVAAVGLLFLSSSAWAGGLRCSVGEVVINNLKIGQTYSLKTLANLPLSITNTGDRSVTVLVDPVMPAVGELRQGAEPIPSLNWATASPVSVELGPSQTEQVEMILAIPDDESLFGRKFQVIFWSHTMAQAGDLLAYGLNSRVIFTIDQVRETPGLVPTGDLAISLVPSEIMLDLDNVAQGREYRLEEFLDQPLSVHNTSEKSLSVELLTLSPENSVATPTPGYEDLLEAAEVKLFPAKFTLLPGEKRMIAGTVTFLKEKRPRGKRFMCVISASVADLPVQTQVYSRVYAHVK